MKNRIIPVEKLAGLMWKPEDDLDKNRAKKIEGGSVSSVVSGVFSVEELDDRYVLHGVEHRGEIISVGWSNVLLDGENSRSQDSWNEYTKNSDFKIPAVDLYFASLRALYNNKEGEQSGLVDKVKSMFVQDFKDYWMTTRTRVKYNSKGKDVIIYDYDSPDVREIETNLAGTSCYIEDGSGLEDQMESLLGIKDLKEIPKICNWYSDKKKTYLWRISKPKEKTERAVVLGVVNFNDGFVIVAVDYIGNYWPARGVVVVRENCSGSEGGIQ